jgi:hypothetical protein
LVECLFPVGGIPYFMAAIWVDGPFDLGPRFLQGFNHVQAVGDGDDFIGGAMEDPDRQVAQARGDVGGICGPGNGRDGGELLGISGGHGPGGLGTQAVSGEVDAIGINAWHLLSQQDQKGLQMEVGPAVRRGGGHREKGEIVVVQAVFDRAEVLELFEVIIGARPVQEDVKGSVPKGVGPGKRGIILTRLEKTMKLGDAWRAR